MSSPSRSGSGSFIGHSAWYGYVRGWLLIVALVGCTSGPTAPPTAQDYIDEYGGSLNTIEFILGYTDCPTLRQTFDAANANAHAFGLTTSRGSEQRGRMAAALDRMLAIGCET